MGPLLAAAKPGDLWMADRNFCTRAILSGWHQQASAFLVREHGCNPNPRELDKPRKVGEVDTGVVFEQRVSLDDDAGRPIVLRRIELRLNRPTEDGQKIIRLLSNLPAAELSALELARLYRRRCRRHCAIFLPVTRHQSRILCAGGHDRHDGRHLKRPTNGIGNGA